MTKPTITPDYEMRTIRVCWRSRRNGRNWGMGEYRPMTDGYAKQCLAWLDQTFPEFEHWIEQRDEPR